MACGGEGLRWFGAVSCRDTASTGVGRERSALQYTVSGWGARLKTGGAPAAARSQR